MSTPEIVRTETLGTLSAALCEPKFASLAWGNLCKQIPFMELSYRSIRLFPAIYRNLVNSRPEEIGRLRGAYRLNWVKNQTAWFSYAPLLEDLKRHNVNYVIAKGFAVAIIVGDLGIRQMGDLDIYIFKRDARRICKLLSHHGFAPKFSKSCIHGSISRALLDSGSYVNSNGHEIDLHLVDSRSDYLHRKLVSEAKNVITFGKVQCRIPPVELLLIKSLRHGEKRVAISDYVQSTWDVARLLTKCNIAMLKRYLRRTGDGNLMNIMLNFLINEIGMPTNVSKFSESKLILVRRLQNLQHLTSNLIFRLRNPISFLRVRNQISGAGLMWALWKSFGSIRPIERMVWKWRGGFLNQPGCALTPGIREKLTKSQLVSFSSPKGVGEVRFRAKAKSKVVEIEFFGVEHLTSSWLLFLNGTLNGSLPIPGQDRYLYPLESSEFEVSLRNPIHHCEACNSAAETLQFSVR